MVFFLIVISCLETSYAQDSLSRRRANPRFWIKVYDERKKLSVRLYEVGDSFLAASKTSKVANYYTRNFESIQLNANRIKSIWYWNTHNTLIGILIGSASGFLVGAIIGSKEESDPAGWFSSTAAEKARGDMIGCTIIGGLAGGVFSQIKIKIPIYGNPINYNKYKSRLEKRSVKHKYLSGN